MKKYRIIDISPDDAWWALREQIVGKIVTGRKGWEKPHGWWGLDVIDKPSDFQPFVFAYVKVKEVKDGETEN
jgi:hypothetical protein